MPSNLGILSFILYVVAGTVMELEGMGMGLVVEGETGVRRVRMPSSFRDMLCMVSPKRARTSARWGGLGE